MNEIDQPAGRSIQSRDRKGAGCVSNSDSVPFALATRSLTVAALTRIAHIVLKQERKRSFSSASAQLGQQVARFGEDLFRRDRFHAEIAPAGFLEWRALARGAGNGMAQNTDGREAGNGPCLQQPRGAPEHDQRRAQGRRHVTWARIHRNEQVQFPNDRRKFPESGSACDRVYPAARRRTA